MAMLVPLTLSKTIGVLSSMTISMLLVPHVEATATLADEPVKLKVRPVPDHESSLVAGLTRPRKRTPLAQPSAERVGSRVDKRTILMMSL